MNNGDTRSGHECICMTRFGKEIVRHYDGYGVIQVFDDGNKRTLMFGENDEQGCVRKHTPEVIDYDYVRAMLLVLALLKDPRQCLILGLGSGALATSLYHHLPLLQIEVVELRQMIIDLGYSHFFLPRSERLKVTQHDAGEFIKTSPATYDIIFSDIYHASGMDAQQGSRKFIEHCLDRLTPDGWLVLNYWQQHKTLDLIPLLLEYFPNIWTNNINKENWIIYASRSSLSLSEKQRKTDIKRLNEVFGFSLSKVAKGMQKY